MTDIDREQTWKVKVFRRESDGIWNQQVLEAEFVPPPTAGAAGGNVNGHAATTTTGPEQQVVTPKRRMTAAVVRRRNQLLKKKSEWVLDAAPRKGSIVFPKVRQRYSICDVVKKVSSGNSNAAAAAAAGDTNTTISNTTTTNDVSERNKTTTRTTVVVEDKSLVVRRGDKILFISRRRTRAMMLQFESLEDCVSFTDKFLMLNHQHHYDFYHHDDVDAHQWSKSTHPRGGGGGGAHVVQATTNVNDHTASVGQETSETSVPFSPKQSLSQQQQEQKEDGSAYLVQLIHDENFLRTVARLEQLFQSSSEGRQILEGAAKRDLTHLLQMN